MLCVTGNVCIDIELFTVNVITGTRKVEKSTEQKTRIEIRVTENCVLIPVCKFDRPVTMKRVQKITLAR